MTQGMFFVLTGVVLSTFGGITILAGNIIYNKKKKCIKEKLYDRYGF